MGMVNNGFGSRTGRGLEYIEDLRAVSTSHNMRCDGLRRICFIQLQLQPVRSVSHDRTAINVHEVACVLSCVVRLTLARPGTEGYSSECFFDRSQLEPCGITLRISRTLEDYEGFEMDYRKITLMLLWPPRCRILSGCVRRLIGTQSLAGFGHSSMIGKAGPMY